MARMVYRPAYAIYSLVAAIVAGILIAKGSYIGGAILVVVAIAIAAARYIVDRRGEDDTFNLWR